MSAITEAGSSKFIDVTEGEINGSIHVNDAGNGDEVVVMFHGSGPGAHGQCGPDYRKSSR